MHPGASTVGEPERVFNTLHDQRSLPIRTNRGTVPPETPGPGGGRSTKSVKTEGLSVDERVPGVRGQTVRGPWTRPQTRSVEGVVPS